MLHPNQFKVNEAWIAFKLNDEAIPKGTKIQIRPLKRPVGCHEHSPSYHRECRCFCRSFALLFFACCFWSLRAVNATMSLAALSYWSYGISSGSLRL